jgi:hypothetical protein
MTQKSIEVIVNTDGTLKIEALGFAGADCEKATAFLERALGVPGTRKRKTDYYKAVTLKKQQRVQR